MSENLFYYGINSQDMFYTIPFMDLCTNHNYNGKASSTNELSMTIINNLKNSFRIFTVILLYSNNIPTHKYNFHHFVPYYSFYNMLSIFNYHQNHMFCTMENNSPIYIYLNHHIFYNLNTFHMNEFLNFYNNLQMDSLTRMIIFLLNSKKILSHMINIHIN